MTRMIIWVLVFSSVLFTSLSVPGTQRPIYDWEIPVGISLEMRPGDLGPYIFNGDRDFHRVVSFNYHGLHLYNAEPGLLCKRLRSPEIYYYHQGSSFS